MKHKILSLLLCLPLLVSGALSLTACGDTKEPAQPTATADTTTSATATATEVTDTVTEAGLTVIEADGTTQFSIVRPDVTDSVTQATAVSLHQAINSAHNAKIGLTTDWVRSTDADGTVTNDAYEILVGDTNRKETALAKEQMGENDYIITVINNKLVIAGTNPRSTKYAVELFIAEMMGTAGTALTLSAEDTRMGDGVSGAIDLADGAHFRIMTFNVLGSSENGDQRYPYIREIIDTYTPDIIGFQEFNAAQHNNTLAPLLRSGYAVNCQYHSDGTRNYTPIVYRKDKFTQVEGGVEWLDSRYTGTNTKSTSWAVLTHNETGTTFAVINLHGAVLSNSYSGYETMSSSEMSRISAGWRVDNVRQILEVMARLKTTYGDIPFLFTGDFNFTTEAEAYNSMKAAGLTEAEISSTGDKVTGTKTTHSVGSTPIAGKSIDHIFYFAESITALRHHVAKDEPFELKASDHCAVFADIAFNK